MDHKYRIDFNESNVLDSVTYTLVSEFNLRPNVLKAVIDGDGSGYMLVSIMGDEEIVKNGMARISEIGFSVKRPQADLYIFKLFNVRNVRIHRGSRI